MVRRRTALLAVLLLLSAHVPLPAQAPDPELAAGIALVREGDFEAAVLKLDVVVRRLLADTARQKEAARAYVYLGVSFLELGQELVARGKFQLAQGLDRTLRLDPREFSPQQIRVFEAARGDVAPSPAAPPRSSPEPGASPAAPAAGGAAQPEAKKKKRNPLPWILGGAAVVGGGLAAAGGGGGGSRPPVGNPSPSPSPSPTPLPSASPTPGPTPEPTPTATPTPAPTPQPTPTPPACTYAMSGPTPPNPFALTGGAGTCAVQAAAGCAWVAEATEPWISLTPPDSGTGSAPVAFTVSANAGSGQRTGRIRLRQDATAQCEIRQNGTGLPFTSADAEVTFASDLDLAGGRAQVVVDGSSATFHAGGPRQVRVAGGGLHRVEATVVSADGKPGTWRFLLTGPVRPGSVRVLAGAVARIGPGEIAFSLSGRPGERLLFSFRSH